MAVVRKKQDDKNLKILRELVSISGNKQCFDCNQKGPTYVNMTIGTFVCTRCSGILRGLTPPHRVKSISMATFTTDEIEFIKSHGNDECAKTWMGLWDPKRTTTRDHRELLVDKYEKKRYYLEPASPLKSINTSQQLSNNNTTSSNSTDNLAALKAITLTPPSSLRLYKNNSTHHQQQNLKNSLNATNNNSNLSSNNNNNISNINNNKNNLNNNNLQQFTPDDSNSLFQTNNKQIRLNNSINNNINNSTSNNNNNLSMNGVNKYGLNITSNGITEHNNNNNNNKFTPESEFVADFSSANIFNSTSLTNKTNNHNNNNSINSNDNQKNSNISVNGGATIPTITNSTGNNENFADFEHNTIYNAAGLPISLSSSNSLNSSGTFNSSSSLNSTPSADRYAALKDLDEQIRENKEKEKLESSVFNQPNPVAIVNPFKVNNPFQTQQTNVQQIPQQQNWTKTEQIFSGTPPNANFIPIPSQIPLNGFQQTFNNNGIGTNGFGTQFGHVGNPTGQFNSTFTQQNSVVTNGFIPQNNPFSTTVASNNPFL